MRIRRDIDIHVAPMSQKRLRNQIQIPVWPSQIRPDDAIPPEERGRLIRLSALADKVNGLVHRNGLKQ
jgi:hypothetical protein